MYLPNKTAYILVTNCIFCVTDNNVLGCNTIIYNPCKTKMKHFPEQQVLIESNDMQAH